MGPPEEPEVRQAEELARSWELSCILYQIICVNLQPKANHKGATKRCRHTIRYATSLWSVSKPNYKLPRHLCVLYGCDPAADMCLKAWCCDSESALRGVS